jgi:hypothetical protein
VARIFLSYAREDEAQVRGVYRRLLDAGFEVWMDKINLLPGQRWQQEIPRAIRHSDFILIFFSKNSVAKRGYVQREFRLALDTLEEMPQDAIHTIPIRLDDCQIPEQFRHLQWSDLSEEGEFDRIVQALQWGIEQRQHFTPEPALEPPPASIPHSDRPSSEAEGDLLQTPLSTPPQEPEPPSVSPPDKPLVSTQKSRRVSVVTRVGLMMAAVGALVAVIVVVPEVRQWLGLDKPPARYEASKRVSQAQTGQVQLAWYGLVQPDGIPISNIAGFKLYSGLQKGQYQKVIPVGMASTYTVSDLSPGKTYYFGLKAYTNTNEESAFLKAWSVEVGSNTSPAQEMAFPE